MNEKQHQKLGDDQSNTNARSQFHDFPAERGIVAGKLGAFHRGFRAPRDIIDAPLGRAAQIEREAAGPNLHDDAPPERLGVMGAGDNHFASPVDGEFAAKDGQGRKNQEP